MKTQLARITITAVLLLTPGGTMTAFAAEESDTQGMLREELVGDWVVVRDVVFDSKSEVEPSVRKLSFGTNQTVAWWYEIGGKPERHSGRFAIRPSQTARLPSVTVSEDAKPDSPPSFRPITFVMAGVTVDFDSRFNVQTVGKVLKFDHRDRKQYVFTRSPKEKEASKPSEFTAAADGQPPNPKPEGAGLKPAP